MCRCIYFIFSSRNVSLNCCRCWRSASASVCCWHRCCWPTSWAPRPTFSSAQGGSPPPPPTDHPHGDDAGPPTTTTTTTTTATTKIATPTAPTPPPNHKPHMDRLFFWETKKKKNTSRYMDRVDTASESGREGGRVGGWGRGGLGWGVTLWDKDCMFMDSLRWGETWGLDQIRTSQGHKELVRHQLALPVANNVYIFFVLGSFFFVSHFSFFKCTKKIWMFVYCHEIGT